MKADCLPFTVIPHVTSLFHDYLYDFHRVRNFFAVDPRDTEAVRAYGARLRHDEQRRQIVADILERQNRAFGASSKTLENIARLRSGALASVSGQQVGLFGGPLYSTFKAISAIRLARDLTASGMESVPVFWLATEDHDLAEVNHATLLSPDGLPEHLETSSRGPKDSPVSEVTFGQEILALTDRARALFGDGVIADAVRDSYRPGESFGTAFAKLFARLFADFGLILLDPSDAALHDVAKPVYRLVIERAGPIDEALLGRGKELRAAGYHEQVKVTSESTLLFEKRDGARTVIHRGNGGFTSARERFTPVELLARIDSEPHRFSANVLLRPAVQDFLLPTVAYFAGAAEIAYFAQAAVVYEQVLQRLTPVLPRFSATLLDARAQRLLDKYSVKLTDLFAGPDATRGLLAARSLPADLQGGFEAGASSIADIFNRLRPPLQLLDPTLGAAAASSQRKMFYQLDRLRKRAAAAELRKNAEVARHADWLTATLYPGKDLQEREIAGISFLARCGRELLENLVESAGCPDHQIVRL